MRQFIADVKARHGCQGHPYLVAVRDGDLPLEAFVETQIQLYFVGRAFCVPVLTLATRLAELGAWESLIEGVLHPEAPEHAVGATGSLRELLTRLGVDDATLSRRSPWPEVRAFSAALRGLCLEPDPRLGLAAVGMVEDVLGGVAAGLGEGIVTRGWLAPEALVHYPVDSPLDVARAEAFYARLDWQYGRDAGARAIIRDGLETGAYLVTRLLDDLYSGGARRASVRDRARTADIARRVRQLAAASGEG